MKETDKKILELLKSGDYSGLEQLFKLFYRPLVMYARQFIPGVEDSEDIVQDVFVRFWESKSYEQVNENIRAYMYRSVRNACLNHLKSHAQFQFDSLDGISETMFGHFPDESDWDDHIREIHTKIDQLPPRTREIFISIVLESKKYKEVAEQMNVSVNTVKTTLSRAMKFLRTDLSKGANIVLTLLMV